MSYVVLLSATLCLVSLCWALALLVNLMDWRIAFLVAVVALVAVDPVLAGLSFFSNGIGFSGEPLKALAKTYHGDLPVLAASGLTLLAVINIGRVIGNGRQNEAALRGSRDDLRRLLDSLPVSIAYVDVGHHFRFVNLAYEDWLGVPGNVILGRTIDDLLDGPTFASIEHHIEKVLQGEPVTFATMVDIPRRGRCFVESSYIPDLGSNGQVRGFFILVKDLTEHKQTEASLEVTQTLVAQTSEIAKVGYWEWNNDDESVTKCSEELARLLGRPYEQMILSDEEYLAFVHPDDRGRLRDAMEVLTEIYAGSIAYRVVRPDGEVRFVQDTTYQFTNSDGEHTRTIGMVRDVTDQRQAERALRESEERFREFVEIASDWYWESDSDFRFVFLSAGVTQAAGKQPEDYLGKTREDLSDLIVDRESWQGHLASIRSFQPFRDFVYAWRSDDGKIRHVRTSGKPFFDSAGNYLGHRGVGSDITHIVDAQTAKRRWEDRLAQAVEAVPASYALFDADDRLVLANRRCREIYETDAFPLVPGVRHEDFVRAYAEKQDAGGNVQSIKPWLEQRLGRRESLAEGVEFRLGDSQWIEISDYLLEDGGIISIGVDTTARRNAEKARRHHEVALAQLLRRNTMGEMAAALAHELNQPLTAVTNFSGGCLRRLQGGHLKLPEILDVMEEICEQSERASEVLRRIRDFVGFSNPEKAPADLQEIMGSVQALAKPELEAAQVATRVRFGERLPQAFADSIEIEQVLLNLVINALEAMDEVPPEERELNIEVSLADADLLEISISDTGPGFSCAHEGEFFKPYFTTKDGGLGMGLAICKTIVEAHAGRIWFENNVQGGATVHLTLPTAGEADRNAA